MSSSPTWCFQEYVAGLSDRMYTVGVYVGRDRRIHGVFTGRKVRGFPADFGDCIVGEACDLPADVLAETQRVVDDLELSGILEFEYKHDEKTGAYRLIEVNPRSWSWIGITPASGVSLPLLAYRDLSGTGPTAATSGANGRPTGSVRYYKAFPDFVNSTVRYRHDHPEWHQSPRSWWRELRRTDTVVVAELHARDYLVAIVATLLEGKTLLTRRTGANGTGERSR